MAEHTHDSNSSGNTRQRSLHKSDMSYNSQAYASNGVHSRFDYGHGFALPQAQRNGNMAMLSHAFQGMNMYDNVFAPRPKNPVLTSNANPQYDGVAINAAGIPQAVWGANGQMMFAGAQPYPAAGQQSSQAMYGPYAPQYLPHAYTQGHEHSPMSATWTPSQATGDIPTLITPRRDSISSGENEAPGTPSYGGYSTYQHGGVAIVNRSPNGTYTTSSASPLQMMTLYGPSVPKPSEVENISPRLKLLITKEPSIPSAIPAPSSPLKPLDRALENLRGETNVYIRGLRPETSDDMLESWGKRFGDIKSSKSIIDHTTGLCKGFGFVRYHNYTDAEDCIRGFHHLGYEVSFARESFYSKLKAIADDDNTNLYVSNLPKSMNEHELAAIFSPHKVCSARILRDKSGMGRGVGFARFESRDVCEDVIKDFSNYSLDSDGEEHTIQIRFADTQEQKHLKQTTAAARQFRSAEYEFATQTHKGGFAGQGQVQYSPGQENVGHSNDFDNYLGTNASVPIQYQRWAQPAWRQPVGRSPLATIPYNSNARRTVAHQSPTVKSDKTALVDGAVRIKSPAPASAASVHSVGATDEIE